MNGAPAAHAGTALTIHTLTGKACWDTSGIRAALLRKGAAHRSTPVCLRFGTTEYSPLGGPDGREFRQSLRRRWKNVVRGRRSLSSRAVLREARLEKALRVW